MFFWPRCSFDLDVLLTLTRTYIQTHFISYDPPYSRGNNRIVTKWLIIEINIHTHIHIHQYFNLNIYFYDTTSIHVYISKQDIYLLIVTECMKTAVQWLNYDIVCGFINTWPIRIRDKTWWNAIHSKILFYLHFK
jgi:hypothetical protein